MNDAATHGPLNIVLVTPEAVPFAKTGGLADVAGALPLALSSLGHSTTLILPLYRCARPHIGPEPLDFRIECPVGDQRLAVRIVEPPTGVDRFRVLLVDYPEYFDRDGLYVNERKEDFPDNCQRFVLLCKAALQAVDRLGMDVDILHVHDWQTGLIPVYLRTTYADHPRLGRARTVFTIHNIAFQGRFPPKDWPLTNLDPALDSRDGLEYWGGWSTMKGGILWSDQLTTVSPSYAVEIRRPEQGCGMDGVLRSRAHRLAGIVNGIDMVAWDPATDPCLPRNYGVATWREGKRECKRALLAALDWSPEDHRPVVGIVGRLTEQKGFDLIPRIAKDLLKADLRFVVLGVGDAEMESMMQQWARIYPDRVWTRIAFDETLARRIYAASDMFLMPSRTEPCGLSQLYAMRYGSIPVVHATGGLLDTVCNATPTSLEHGQATGFHFHPFGPGPLVDALTRALEAWRSPEVWGRLVDRAMREDWSWNKVAAQYETIYREAISAPQGPGFPTLP